MTKLKTQKTFLKGPRMKINNKKNTRIEIKKKRQTSTFFGRERK
jgi:hypothetical protein